MKEILLVDGYNVIGAWAEATEKNWPIDESRDRLSHLLEEYAALHKQYVILVFDGYKSDRLSTSYEKRKSMEIVFTKKDETADSYIEKAVYNAPKYCKVYVATSDALQQYSVLGDGGYRMSSRELLTELSAMRAKAKQRVILQGRNKSSVADAIPRDLFERLDRFIKRKDK